MIMWHPVMHNPAWKSNLLVSIFCAMKKFQIIPQSTNGIILSFLARSAHPPQRFTGSSTIKPNHAYQEIFICRSPIILVPLGFCSVFSGMFLSDRPWIQRITNTAGPSSLVWTTRPMCIKPAMTTTVVPVYFCSLSSFLLCSLTNS